MKEKSLKGIIDLESNARSYEHNPATEQLQMK